MSCQQHAEVLAPKTQQFSLIPDIDKFMTERVITLDNATDFGLWKSLISFRLQRLNCQDLIRGDLARPKPRDVGHAAWVYYSKTIGEWIYNQLSTDIKQQLDNGGVTEQHGLFADELMEKIEVTILGERFAQGIVAKLDTFWALHAMRYTSVDEFLCDVHSQMQAFHGAKVPIPWIVALATILRELEADLPLVAIMRDELKDMPPDQLTEEKFITFSDRLKIEAKSVGL